MTNFVSDYSNRLKADLKKEAFVECLEEIRQDLGKPAIIRPISHDPPKPPQLFEKEHE